ncbi:hypothetical protein [Desulfonema magnum]|uniref:Fibronectin type-III domain-containing protein n=1 Tax=Desulfonema magnum TaxID=45655 RepID=A0A975BI96_9BACT|nr:hypothetical protein [Desulfonema magnum]QTA85892.1 Uncharacterized protein dnm_019090 [Desulfonema magnum]
MKNWLLIFCGCKKPLRSIFALRKEFSIAVLSLLAILGLVFMNVQPAWSAVTQTAVVVTTASDYTSGAHAVVTVDPVGGPRAAQINLVPTKSDLSIAAYGNHFYRIGRYQMDHITKFDINAPDTAIWQFSVLSPDTESANPHDMIFVSEEKAYVLRYGTANAWIINPSATTEDEFKIGELDLSAYDDGDGVPEMHSGTIADGKLFITFQRQDRSGGYGNWILNDAWMAVIDTETDTEITTGFGNDTMHGIPLPAKNPQSIRYLEENNTIYVQCAGDLMDAVYSGGIVSINPATYETSLLIDDGDEDNHPYGNIAGMAVVSPTKGYFVGYAGWGDNSLYTFDPSTGNVEDLSIEYLNNKNLAGMETGAYIDKNGMLWVCNATDGELVIINTADDSVDEKISTELNPQKVVFITEHVNLPPNKPVLASPDESSEEVSLTPELRTGEFSDPDAGDTHTNTQWQISTAPDFSSIVLDVTDASNLTSLPVGGAVLEENTTYYWRTAFYDGQNAASEWSDSYAFETGSAPDENLAPNKPELSSPDKDSKEVSLTPELQTEAFSDPDEGDTHSSTQWQISTDPDFSSTVLDVTDDSNLTSLKVESSVLEKNTTYYWRVAFYDSQNLVSEWSEAYAFETGSDDDDDSSGGTCFISATTDGSHDFMQKAGVFSLLFFGSLMACFILRRYSGK